MQLKCTKRLLLAMVASVVLLALPGVSLIKYALYELSGAAPALRDAIGKTVRLPQREYDVNWRAITAGPHEGVLKSVRYRWNDKLGFFDLEVEWSGGSTGLSPFEAMGVEVIAP